jgi:hypothetical protein
MASSLHITSAATATYPPTVHFDTADEDEDGRCYALETRSGRLIVDPSQKGDPGDLVVVWRKKRGPLITRRIARQSPFGTFWFRSLETGEIFELPCNKVSTIHAVVGGELEG